MRLYVAGNVKSVGSYDQDYRAGVRNRLLSYAFLEDWAKDEFMFWVHEPPQHACVFLDSGAFSARSLGRTIDLGAYCAYIEQYRPALAAYAVLDVIEDLSATEANLAAMRARGLDPVPIYHVDREPLDVLHGLLQESGYVGIGGMAASGFGPSDTRKLLDACFRAAERLWPVRLHGLGVMAQWVLERYPFYSADSSSAVRSAGMGGVTRFRLGPKTGGAGLLGRTGGTVSSAGWRSDVQVTFDGDVADGIGRVRSGNSKSESAHQGRRMRNIEAQLALERYVTDLWTQRGVTWTT